MIQNLIDILASPTAVFKRLQSKPDVLLPLLLLIVATASVQVGYIMLTDFSFLMDQMIDQALATNPNIRESEIRPTLENLSPMVLSISGVASTVVLTLIIYALYASYLSFVGKFGTQEYTFKHWFSLICWTSMPTLLVAVAAWAVILSSSNGQISQTDLQPLGLDALLALNSGNALFQYLSLPLFWSMALLMLGYQHFTGKTLLKSALIALLPYLLIFGIWALITLL